MKTKECVKCGRTLPRAAFRPFKSGIEGLRPNCKECEAKVKAGGFAGKLIDESGRRLRPPKGDITKFGTVIRVDGCGKQPSIEALLVETIWETIDIKLEKVVEEFKKGNHQLRCELLKSRAEVLDLKAARAEDIDRDIDKGIGG